MDHSGLTTLLKLFVKGALQYVKLFKYKMYPFWRKYRPSLLTLFGGEYRPSLLTLFGAEYRPSLLIVMKKNPTFLSDTFWKEISTLPCDIFGYRPSLLTLLDIDPPFWKLLDKNYDPPYRHLITVIQTLPTATFGEKYRPSLLEPFEEKYRHSLLQLFEERYHPSY